MNRPFFSWLAMPLAASSEAALLVALALISVALVISASVAVSL